MTFRTFAILMFSGSMVVSISSFCESLTIWNDTNDAASVMVYYVDSNKNNEKGPRLDIKAGSQASINIDMTKGILLHLDLLVAKGESLTQSTGDFPIVKGSNIDVVWNGINLKKRERGRPRAGAMIP